MSINDGTGENWVETLPGDDDIAGNGPVEIRDLRKGVNLRVEKEHVPFADGTVGGEHKQGSAKVYYQSAAPTLRPDGVTALDSTDYGRIWIDSDTGLVYRYLPAGWTLGGNVACQAYTGTGAIRSFVCGFQPTMVIFFSTSGNVYFTVTNNIYGPSFSTIGGAITYNVDGFTIGATAQINTNSSHYNFVAVG